MSAMDDQFLITVKFNILMVEPNNSVLSPWTDNVIYFFEHLRDKYQY